MVIPTTIAAAGGIVVKIYVSGGYFEYTVKPDPDMALERSTYNTLNKICAITDFKESTTWPGSGTQDEPYLISTKANLELFATNVNGGTKYSGKYFKVTNDIDLKGSSTDQWTTVGIFNTSYDDSSPFSGNFDGTGHSQQYLFGQHIQPKRSFRLQLGRINLQSVSIRGHLGQHGRRNLRSQHQL